MGGGVTTRDGIEMTMFTAGAGKDLGNPYRPLTDAETQRMQSIVDGLYQTFVQHVVDGRDVSPSTVTDSR